MHLYRFSHLVLLLLIVAYCSKGSETPMTGQEHDVAPEQGRTLERRHIGNDEVKPLSLHHTSPAVPNE
jgi:hypothetical protein